MIKVLVTGASGFLGGWLTRYLSNKNCWVRAVDHVLPRYGDVSAHQRLWNLDLRYIYDAKKAVEDMDWVFHLAAHMGGMGVVGKEHFKIISGNPLIDINIAKAAALHGVKRLLFTSSACSYPERLQMSASVPLLREEEAWDGKADTAYGTAKRFSEEVFLWLAHEKDIDVRIARFHNIMGERGSWCDGTEKLPAAACRKVAQAKLTGTPDVEVWGDGTAVRSFMHASDCIEALHRLMKSSYGHPMNIGTDRAASVNEVFNIVAEIAGIDINLVHVDGPVGVQSRNANLSLQRDVLGFEPQVSLEDGLSRVYHWVYRQAKDSLGGSTGGSIGK